MSFHTKPFSAGVLVDCVIFRGSGLLYTKVFLHTSYEVCSVRTLDTKKRPITSIYKISHGCVVLKECFIFFSLSRLCEMGCYGIGVSRLLAAMIEYGCTFDEERLLWPPFIAPFFVCVVPLSTSQAS